MKQLPDKCFTLSIADPPYGIRDAGGATGGAGKLRGRAFNNGKIDRWDKAPGEDFFRELFRVSENVIIWGGNYFHLPPTRCFVCWDKVQPWPNFSQVEYAWTSFTYPSKLFRFDNRTGEKIHPTQKPVELYAYLLQQFAHEGGGNFRPDDGQSVFTHCLPQVRLRLHRLRDRRPILHRRVRTIREGVHGSGGEKRGEEVGATEFVLGLAEPKKQREQSQARLGYAESRLRKTKSKHRNHRNSGVQ